MRPIFNKLKSNDFEFSMLGLIPVSIQYFDTILPRVSTNDVLTPLLSNSAIKYFAEKFALLDVFHGPGRANQICYVDVKKMLKHHNKKNFPLK